MVTEVGVWLFDVSRCGYYEPASARAGHGPLYGGLSECMGALRDWTVGRRLSETSTSDVKPDTEQAKTYFLSLTPAANGDFLLALWNRIQTNSNKIASVGVNDIVGAVTTEFTEIDEDRIPGFATYFYVMPAEGKIASVRVKHPMNGLHNFKSYLYNFLKFVNPRHVVAAENESGEIDVVGYRPDSASEDIRKLRAQFRLQTIPKMGEAQYIIDNFALIKRAICKTTITNTVPDQREWWQRGMDVLGLGARRGRMELEDQVVIKAELPMNFIRPEVEAIVQEWQDRHAVDGDREDDIGFVLQGESAPRWLSKSYARKAFDLEVQWMDDELVETQALLAQLQLHRRSILALGN